MTFARYATCWTRTPPGRFPATTPLSGAHRGIDAIVAFFDAMGSVMGSAQPTVERLVMGVNDQHIVECQHIRTNRADGPDINQHLCVLWSFANGKITSGRTWQPTRTRWMRSMLCCRGVETRAHELCRFHRHEDTGHPARVLPLARVYSVTMAAGSVMDARSCRARRSRCRTA